MESGEISCPLLKELSSIVVNGNEWNQLVDFFLNIRDRELNRAFKTVVREKSSFLRTYSELQNLIMLFYLGWVTLPFSVAVATIFWVVCFSDICLIMLLWTAHQNPTPSTLHALKLFMQVLVLAGIISLLTIITISDAQINSFEAKIIEIAAILSMYTMTQCIIDGGIEIIINMLQLLVFFAWSSILLLTNELYNHIPFLLVQAVLTILIMNAVRVSSIYSFMRCRNVLARSHAKAKENEALELRTIIGNVAHDLKTPLSSMLSGMETMNQVLSELRKNIVDDITDSRLSTFSSSIDSSIHIGQRCVKNMQHTYAFMLMSINRCLDFTKASRGVRLKPTYEIFDLMEALSLPLSCMREMQSKLGIKFIVGKNPDECELELLKYNPQHQREDNKRPIRRLSDDPSQCEERNFSQRIAARVITDKQWLQENLLCLLSNAVKYSRGEEEVTVRALLEPIYDVQQRRRIDCSQLQSEESIISDNYDEIPFNANTRRVAPLESALSETLISYDDHDRIESLLSNQLPTISPEKAESYLTIEVEDTGVGMNNEAISGLFTPFKQAQRLAGGTGLGLYSLRKRVEALHGKCGVKKRRDGRPGSLFWFSIPYFPESNTLECKPSDRINDQMTIDPFGFLRSSEIYHRRLAENNSPKSLHKLLRSRVNSDYDSMEEKPFAATTTTASTELDRANVQINTETSMTVHQVTPAMETTNIQRSISNAINEGSRNLNSSPKSCKRILVVDDSPAIVKMTSMMLRMQGHQVTSACNGAEAYAIIQERISNYLIHSSKKNSESSLNSTCELIDVILMDLQMPIMDGLEATRRIRQLTRYSLSANIATDDQDHDSNQSSNNIQSKFDVSTYVTNELLIVGVSANSDYETKEVAIQAGMNGFLPKPFTAKSFAQLCGQLIAQS